MRGNQKTVSDSFVDIGIVCALELESTAIVRRMGRRQKTIGSGFTVVSGIMSGRRVAVVRSDAGRSKLAKAADALLTVHRPKWLIAAGFGVGIDGQAKRGELIVAIELVNDHDQVQSTSAGSIAATALAKDARAGRLISIAALPRPAADKRLLAQRSGAIAADQDSWSLARVAFEHGVPFLSVRVLIDDASQNAEPESSAVYHPSTSYRFGGIVGAFMSGKGHVGKVWKIRSTAKRHADRLADFLGQLMPLLIRNQ
jgi:adenosylhomocysteine nucleosidase